MKIRLQILILLIIIGNFLSAQSKVYTPTIMVIPYTKKGENLRIIMDNNVLYRVAITKIKEGFDSRGYTTVDFVGKLNLIKDNQVFNLDAQQNIQSNY